MANSSMQQKDLQVPKRSMPSGQTIKNGNVSTMSKRSRDAAAHRMASDSSKGTGYASRSGRMCDACGVISHDARQVCGNCVLPLPGAIKPLPSHLRSVKRPGLKGSDGNVNLLHLSTGRTYRVYQNELGAQRIKSMEVPSPSVKGCGDEPECDEDFARDGGTNPSAASTRRTIEYSAKGDAPTARQSKNKQRSSFTHFISIPIGTLPTVAASANRLLDAMRSFTSGHSAATPSSSGAKFSARATDLSPELVAPTGSLHLTLLMLRLGTPEKVALAKELLHHFKKTWTEKAAVLRKEPHLLQQWDESSGQPRVSMGGLHLMPNRSGQMDAQRASVVYMGFRDAGSHEVVQHIQETIHSCFQELIEDPMEANESRTLHMTLLNRKWSTTHEGKTFDASSLLQDFSQAYIGAGEDGNAPFTLDRVEISICGTMAPSGVYVCEAQEKL